MKDNLRTAAIFFLITLFAVYLAACNGSGDVNGSDAGNGDSSDTYDVDAHGIPKFVNTDYIELAQIYQISKFRSGVGHDYSDNFESCRSMKHYFQPDASADWSTVQIFSPVDGFVSKIREEWAGTQVQIQSKEYPAFYFIIFHISLNNPLNAGDQVTAGQQLGTHIGSQTMSDIAVGVSTPGGWKLVSYFDVINDFVFQDYQTRGLTSRYDSIISQEERDADSLSCVGEEFADSGNLDNWVVFN